MKKFSLLLTLYLFYGTVLYAQGSVFNTQIYNSEYDIFMELNLYEEKIKIPGQDILGKVYGYLKKTTDSRIWIVMDVNISSNGKSARIEMVNDYGSEDLVASLSVGENGVYVLKQLEGSALKVAGKGKWIKLPKILEFVVKEKK